MEVNHPHFCVPAMFLLFLLIFKTGFSAEISKFVKTGDSVQLDLQTQERPAEFDELSWMNEKSKNIVKYITASKKVRHHDSYKDRVDFNTQSFSMTLKNMQKADSGVYRATTSGSETKVIVTYRVSVIDAVEAPVLTINSNWSSSDSCIVNFTCRAHDLNIDSSYQRDRCSPKNVTHESYTIILHCSEKSIFCNYSNPVSREEDRMEIKSLCVNMKDTNLEKNIIGPNMSWSWESRVILILCLALLAVIIPISMCLYLKKKKGAREGGSTVYDQVQVNEMQKINSDSHTYDVPERIQAQTQGKSTDNRPSTTYCTVGEFSKPTIPPETDNTIYSTVCKQPPRKQKEI